MKFRYQKGNTLIELLIYAALTLLLLSAVYAAFRLSWRYYKAQQSAVEAQQEVVKALQRINEEVRASAASRIHVERAVDASTPTALVFVSARVKDTDERLIQVDPDQLVILWQSWVCIYHHARSQELRLKRVALSDGSLPAPGDMSASEILTAEGTEQVLARHVQEVDFLDPYPSSYKAVTASLHDTDYVLEYTVSCRTESRDFGVNELSIPSRVLVQTRSGEEA